MYKNSIEDSFKKSLKSIFQFNKNKIDLDFGIYKIFKYKQNEIYNFIENQLLNIVNDKLKKELDNKDEIDSYKSIVFENIVNFFKRYYDNGNFYPLPYSINYSSRNNKNVFFHWATKDLFYIKNFKYYHNYSFIIDDKEIIFNINEDKIEDIKSNNKDNRKFFFTSIKQENNKIFIDISHKAKIKNSEKELTTDNLYKELKVYVKINKNTLKSHINRFKKLKNSDFFIHKNLKEFLTKELDYYLKNEIIDFENIESLKEAKIIREIALEAIKVLSNIEALLLLLWEKKRFVYNVNYAITLDRLKDIGLIKLIENSQYFNKQKEEWFKLGLIDNKSISISKIFEDWNNIKDLKIKREWLNDNQQKKADNIFNEETLTITLEKIFNKDYKLFKRILKRVSRNLDIEEDRLKEIVENYRKYKTLPIDTKFFKEIEFKILEQFNNLDNELDGILIKSDNYQAINILLSKYKNRVQSIYIDPPFNKDKEADYLYRVNYADSSWITMLENRIKLAKDLLSDKGSFFVRCDYKGNMYIRLLMDNIFGEENFKNEIIISRSGIQKEAKNKFLVATESLFFYSKKEKTKPSELYEHRETDWLPFVHYPVERKENRERDIFGYKLYPPKGRHWGINQKLINAWLKNRWIRFRCKKCGYEHYEGIWKSCPKCNSNEFIPEIKNPPKKVDSNWSNIKSYSQDLSFPTRNAEELLKRVIESSSNKGDLVMDFFLGSGTTTIVAHKLKRKWIGIEMGDHFYSVVLPKMKKVLFYDKSGISKEKDVKEYYNENNAGGFFKYYELEQYEDVLENIEIKNINNLADFKVDNFKSLSIMLDDPFLNRPFDFALKIDGKKTKIDLIETFNLMKPIKVKKMFERNFNNKRYVFIIGSEDIVIWREIDNLPLKKDLLSEIELIDFCKSEENFIRKEIGNDIIKKAKKVYMNATEQFYPKNFLNGKISDILSILNYFTL